jgi:hypothetical protein
MNSPQRAYEQFGDLALLSTLNFCHSCNLSALCFMALYVLITFFLINFKEISYYAQEVPSLLFGLFPKKIIIANNAVLNLHFAFPPTTLTIKKKMKCLFHALVFTVICQQGSAINVVINKLLIRPRFIERDFHTPHYT